MKDTKRCFSNFSFYDQQAIQAKLEEMAAKGWMIEKPGNFWWTYRKTEPKKLHFSVTYFPKASEFDPGPSNEELTKEDFCAQDGWILAARWGVMQIFYNEREDAIPIETDPVTQVENIHKAMKKNVLLPQLIMFAYTLYYLAVQIMSMRRDPVDYLSDPFYMYSLPFWVGILAACAYEVWFYFHWFSKAKRAAEQEGVFLAVKSRRLASWLLLLFSCLWMILAYSGASTTNRSVTFALIWMGVVFFIIFAGNMIKAWLRKKGASRGVNQVFSIGSVVLMTSCCFGVLIAAVIGGGFTLPDNKEAVGTYDHYGITREIYDDALPLEIEDLTEVDAEWTKEANHQETILLSYTEYSQNALPNEANHAGERQDLEYTITDVKVPILYDFIKRAQLNSHQDEVNGDFIFYDSYFPIDASVWNADEAYQLRWNSSIMNIYLLCWENRIVEIKFYWEPTEEEIAKAAEILGN